MKDEKGVKYDEGVWMETAWLLPLHIKKETERILAYNSIILWYNSTFWIFNSTIYFSFLCSWLLVLFLCCYSIAMPIFFSELSRQLPIGFPASFWMLSLHQSCFHTVDNHPVCESSGSKDLTVLQVGPSGTWGLVLCGIDHADAAMHPSTVDTCFYIPAGFSCLDCFTVIEQLGVSWHHG
jgi:hypothetical protein